VTRPLYVLVTFVATWLASIALFLYFEEPVNLLIRHRFKSKDRSVGMQATLFQMPLRGPPVHTTA
jgi:hypothetical protein